MLLNVDLRSDFGFIVLERQSGLLLFTGRVTERELTDVEGDPLSERQKHGKRQGRESSGIVEAADAVELEFTTPMRSRER